ncbi:CAAX prenyl protease 2 [Ceratobasidium sp. AG-Ba]|nr:CAAX prenyl protease 2 [Ceratobasidium sp. AG-Ba]
MPVLSTSQFILASGIFSGSYVGSIYVLQSARLGGANVTRSRDDPKVIKARLAAVSVSTIGSMVGLGVIVWKTGNMSTIWDAIQPTAKLLGLTIPVPAFRPLLLTPLLYLGPLYSAWLDQAYPFMDDWSFQRDVVRKFGSWTGVRNFFASPLTEELVFRSCVIGAAQLAGVGLKKIVFLTPLWFGIAHIHHANEQFNRLGRTKKALQQAVVISTVQLAYTTVFGWYASFLFVRTGSVIVPTLAHTFCNLMGMPSVGQDVRDHPNRKMLIWLTHLAGLIGFGFALGPWTSH